jgi:hypothetical protein
MQLVLKLKRENQMAPELDRVDPQKSKLGMKDETLGGVDTIANFAHAAQGLC